MNLTRVYLSFSSLDFCRVAVTHFTSTYVITYMGYKHHSTFMLICYKQSVVIYTFLKMRKSSLLYTVVGFIHSSWPIQVSVWYHFTSACRISFNISFSKGLLLTIHSIFFGLKGDQSTCF